MTEDRIDELYNQYGFTRYRKEDEYRIYIFDQGYFHNAEIVGGDCENDPIIEKQKQDLLRAGYSVSIKKKNDIDKVERDLFNGFFKIDASNKRVKTEYVDFCNLQTKKNGGNKYSYIASKYTVNGFPREGDIVNGIYEQLYSDGAQLVILEAPAGFGKTCTSYEISNLIADKAVDEVPILCELSKNRLARIFKYVLSEEIENKFSGLSRRLVVEQIIKGKVLLIIDGFDELLSKSSIDGKESSDDAKSMLDTVAELFQDGSNAKVVLTSRKSSIFVGKQFDEWVEGKIQTCTLNRYQILSPTVSDWLGGDKKDKIEKAGVDLAQISNPVLLSFLRNNDEVFFDDKWTERGYIINRYLDLILNREKERQLLLLDADEQRWIFRRLAAMMVQLDITSDDSEGIKALIEEIVIPRIDIYLEKYNYSSEADNQPPTIDEFVMKLVHNALLDRVKVNSNYIGFLNEFIFGDFIGQAIVKQELDIKEVGEQYLSYAISSFGAESISAVGSLLECIEQIKTRLTTEQKLLIQYNLTHRMVFDYIDEYFADYIFDDTVDYAVDSVFLTCIFTNCTFSNIIVLEQFWMTGSQRAGLRKSYTTLYKGIDPAKRFQVSKAIDRLCDKGILRKLNNCLELDKTKMKEVKNILGR